MHFETDPRQDVLRRDFTINALMLDPDTGEVLDLRRTAAPTWSAASCAPSAIPTTRFREDHLRLLRAVRFAARLGFRDRAGHHRRRSPRLHALILKVSAERVRDELVRILTEGGARRGFELLDADAACWPISCRRWRP